jgi:hypothetical protein
MLNNLNKVFGGEFATTMPYVFGAICRREWKMASKNLFIALNYSRFPICVHRAALRLFYYI